MKNLMSSIQRFVQDEEGVTAIEYGLIAALISIGIIAGATIAGDNLELIFDKIGAELLAAKP
jgi:pilus assembly protein Flp/PilA